jgi:hypothetical protein
MMLHTLITVCVLSTPVEIPALSDGAQRAFLDRSDMAWEFDTKDSTTLPSLWFDAPFIGRYATFPEFGLTCIA